MSTQDGDDAFDIGGLWSSDEEGPTNGPCPTPLGPLDSKTLLDLGLERHDVPGDGNCMVHAFLKNQRSTSHAAQTTSTSVQHTRESLAKFVETHARAFVTTHSTRGVWPWYRDNWRGDPPTVCGGPASSQAAPSALSACHRHSAPGPLGLCAGPFIQSSSPSQSACAMVRDVGPSAHDTGHKALMPGVTTTRAGHTMGAHRHTMG